jgi:hypothetical protein
MCDAPLGHVDLGGIDLDGLFRWLIDRWVVSHLSVVNECFHLDLHRWLNPTRTTDSTCWQADELVDLVGPVSSPILVATVKFQVADLDFKFDFKLGDRKIHVEFQPQIYYQDKIIARKFVPTRLLRLSPNPFQSEKIALLHLTMSPSLSASTLGHFRMTRWFLVFRQEF